jgi:hypothetical protein
LERAHEACSKSTRSISARFAWLLPPSAPASLPPQGQSSSCVTERYLAVWSERCVGALKVAWSNPCSGSESTFRSGLLLARKQYVSAHCGWLSAVLPGTTLLSQRLELPKSAG